MKKKLALLLACSMALSLTACGGGSKPAETTAAPETTTAAASEAAKEESKEDAAETTAAEAAGGDMDALIEAAKAVTDTESADGEFATLAKVTYTDHGMEKTFEGVGNGPIDAVQRGLEEALGVQIKVLDYNEHALNSGSNAQAASYIHLMDKDSGKVTYGVGVSSNITRSSIRGIFSAVNRLFFS